MAIEKTAGFSLIELLVVIAIVGLLSAIAIPAYNAYTIKSKIISAMTVFDNVLAAQKTFYAKNGYFGSLTDVGLPLGNASYEANNPAQFSPYINELGVGARGDVCVEDGSKFGIVWIAFNSGSSGYSSTKSIGISTPIGIAYRIREVNGVFVSKCFYYLASASVAASYLPAACQTLGTPIDDTHCVLPW